MRIITGSARGRRLTAPEGTDVRPTAEVTKEAVFSAIHFEVEGARMLDLFAGTGQMGLEAISRGAKSVTFVESGRPSLEALHANIAACGFTEQCKVFAMDALLFLKIGGGEYDVAFIDPPYNQGLVQAALPLVAQQMAPGGVILCETDRHEEMPQEVGNFRLIKTRRYGKAMIHTYRIPEEE